MIRRDYIMRMVEQFAKVASRILRLEEDGQFEEALTVIDKSLNDFFGLNSHLVSSLSYKDLLLLLGGDLNPTKSLILADFLKEEGGIFDKKDEPDESCKRYLKSLNIFLSILVKDEEIDIGEYLYKIGEIVDKLKKYRLPTETKYKLFHYYEKVGKYSKAEELLFELIEIDHPENDIVEEGNSFYKRLMEKDDSELIDGDLPRDEVKEGLARIREIKKKQA